MIEIGVLDPIEDIEGGNANTGLAKLNRILDGYNADGAKVFEITSITQNLVPNLQPHTIGPDGAPFIVNQRPTYLDAANIILNANTPNAIRQPLAVRELDWWQNKRAYAVQSTLPTDVYYSAAWPNGQLFIWCVPTVAYPLELWMRTVIDQLQLTTKFSLPPGYLDGVVYDLAKALAPGFAAPWTPALEELRRDALRKMEQPNLTSPQMATQDAGIPRGNQPLRSTFNWLTGLNR